MLGALLSNRDVNKNLLHSPPLIKWCISPLLFCKTAKTHVCKHVLYATHRVVVQVLSQPSIWLILIVPHSNVPAASSEPEMFLPAQTAVLHSLSRAETSPVNNIRLEQKAPFPSQNTCQYRLFSRTFWGCEDIGLAYEICTSKHSFQIYGNVCVWCIWLW